MLRRFLVAAAAVGLSLALGCTGSMDVGSRAGATAQLRSQQSVSTQRPRALSSTATTDATRSPVLTATVDATQSPVLTATVDAAQSVTVRFLDVGQGSAVLVQGDEYCALIDFGQSTSKLLAGLQAAGVTHLDALFVTHPDLDHYGAWRSLIDEGYVDAGTVFYEPTFYMPQSQITAGYGEMKEALESQQIQVVSIDTSTQERLPANLRANIEVLWPNPENSSVITDKNDNSLTFDVHSGEADVFVTGDIGKKVEGVLSDSGYQLGAMEVYGVSHHGSRYSSALQLLDILKPQIAVISVGKNGYGHPHPDTIGRLELTTAKYSSGGMPVVYRTDQQGMLSIELPSLEVEIQR